MPPRRRLAAKQEPTEKIVILKMERVPVADLHHHPRNPNTGDVKAIARSLDTTGQYRPIVVNIGTHTGRPNEVLAGNHTLDAAALAFKYQSGGVTRSKPAWESVWASFVDVDEDTATTILLADNETASLGERNRKVVGELLSSLPEVQQVATGYNADEIDRLVTSAQGVAAKVDVDSMLAGIRGEVSPAQERKILPRAKDILENEDEEHRIIASKRGAVRAGEDPEAEEEAAQEEAELMKQADAMTRLQIAYELKEQAEAFPLDDNEWGIPSLLEDNILAEFPRELQTWGGYEATPDDGKKWFLYNYGLGGVKGLPFERVIMCFYTHDHKFDNWWNLPAYYTAKHVARGCTTYITPDFSFYYTTPRCTHLSNVYRGLWMARFWQECGLTVVPRVQFADKSSFEFNMLGIPQETPTLAFSLQNTPVEGGGKLDNEKFQAALVQIAVDHLRPTQSLVYGGPPAQRIMERVNWRNGVAFWQPNYAHIRRGTMFDKGDGSAKLTAGQRKKLKTAMAKDLNLKEKGAEMYTEDDVFEPEDD